MQFARDTAAEKYKKVCEDFPNLAIFTKSATPGKIQLTSRHAAVGKKASWGIRCGFRPSRRSKIAFCNLPKDEIAFAADGENIRLTIAEVLLCAAAGDLARSKNQRDLTPRKAILLPPFLTEATILHGD